MILNNGHKFYCLNGGCLPFTSQDLCIGQQIKHKINQNIGMPLISQLRINTYYEFQLIPAIFEGMAQLVSAFRFSISGINAIFEEKTTRIKWFPQYLSRGASNTCNILWYLLQYMRKMLGFWQILLQKYEKIFRILRKHCNNPRKFSIILHTFS